MKRLSVDAIRALSADFDDIVARNLRPAYDAIQTIPELFGYTRYRSLRFEMCEELTLD